MANYVHARGSRGRRQLEDARSVGRKYSAKEQAEIRRILRKIKAHEEKQRLEHLEAIRQSVAREMAP